MTGRTNSPGGTFYVEFVEELWCEINTSEPITAESIRTTDDGLIIVRDGREVSIPWSACPDCLAKAGSEERLVAELSPSGYGVHWPLIDEDLTIGGLLERAPRSGDENDTR